MSSGFPCTCPGTREERLPNWIIAVYEGNYSSFGGGVFQNSDYSEVKCVVCGSSWRTKAAYVDRIASGEFGRPKVRNE